MTKAIEIITFFFILQFWDCGGVKLEFLVPENSSFLVWPESDDAQNTLVGARRPNNILRVALSRMEMLMVCH